MQTATAQAQDTDVLAPSPNHPLPAVQAQRPLTVIEAAIKSGATADQLERLLDLQVRADNHQLELMREKRRMDEEDRKVAAELAYRRDFALFKGLNIVVPKTKFVDRDAGGSFMQAEFSEACKLLAPGLSEFGFSFRHDQQFGAREWPADGSEPNVPAGTMLRMPWVTVVCFLEHKDGHSETLTLEGPPGDARANTPVQNMQVTATLLKRQSLLAITGTATEEEDNEAQLRRKQASEQRQQSALEALRTEGQDKALEGTAPLLAWWKGITAKQRNELSADFPKWRRAAETADKQSKGAA